MEHLGSKRDGEKKRNSVVGTRGQKDLGSFPLKMIGTLLQGVRGRTALPLKFSLESWADGFAEPQTVCCLFNPSQALSVSEPCTAFDKCGD